MKNVYVVSQGYLQFAFHDLKEAIIFSQYLDKNKGASSKGSIIHGLVIHNNAIQLIKREKDLFK